MRGVSRVTIVTPFYPPDAGGIAVHVYELVNKLTSLGIRCQVITCAKDINTSCSLEKVGDELEVIRINSITPISFPETMKNFRIPFCTSHLSDKIISFDPDVIHLHGHHYPINWLIAMNRKFRDIPKVLTMHGMYALNPYKEGGKTLIEELFNQSIFRCLLSNVDSVIALTPTIAKYVVKYHNKKPVFVIPNGVNLKNFKKNLHRKLEYRKKYNLPEDKKVILFRGRFNHVKGVIDYSRAAAILSKQRDDLYFLAVGGGPLEQFVKEIFRKYVYGKVMSWVPYEKIHELYIASDIYVLPSKWEALPITLIEAMASGLVIVATKISSIMDVLKEYPRSILLYRSSVGFLVKGILRALELLSTTRREHELKTLEEYDWHLITQKIINVYAYTSCRRYSL